MYFTISIFEVRRAVFSGRTSSADLERKAAAPPPNLGGGLDGFLTSVEKVAAFRFLPRLKAANFL